MAIILPSPETRKWTQPNAGELAGFLWASQGIDLKSAPGRIRLAPRAVRSTDSTDDADLGYPTAFVRTDADGTDRWWALCHQALFKTASTDPTGAFTQDAIASSPTNTSHIFSDMFEFEGSLIVTKSTNIDRLASGTWTPSWWTGTLGQSNLSSSHPHPGHVGFNNLACIGDGNFVHTIDRNFNVRYRRLRLPSEFQVISIRSGTDRYWITTRNLKNRRAKEFEWDGFSDNFNREYDLGHPVAFGAVLKKDVPYVLNGNGELLKFTGASFEVRGRLPIASESVYQDSPASLQIPVLQDTLNPVRNVHWNGLALIDEEIHVLLNAALNTTNTFVLDNMHSGVWAFDEEIGFYHKHLVSQYKDTRNDYGQAVLNVAGALTPTSKEKGRFLLGAGIYTDNTTTEVKGIFYADVNDTQAKRGYIITPKMQASAVEDIWQRVWAKWRRMRNASDAMVVKYRTAVSLVLPFRASVTWTSTTQFTSTDANFANAAVGDEVEVLVGKGAGAMAHITQKSLAGSTYTITIDETITGAAGTAQVRVNNWTKLGTFSSQTITYDDLDVFLKSTFAQLKIELRGTGDSPELEEIQITSKAAQEADEN